MARRAGSPSTRLSWAGSPGRCWSRAVSAVVDIAAVTCQLARDRGGPQIAGQLLVCPVTDCTFDRPSYNDNAAGYFLTRSLNRKVEHAIASADQSLDLNPNLGRA